MILRKNTIFNEDPVYQTIIFSNNEIMIFNKNLLIRYLIIPGDATDHYSCYSSKNGNFVVKYFSVDCALCPANGT